MTPLLGRYFARLDRGQPWRWRGQVLESVGQTIESAGPLASVGECCEIQDQYGHAAPGRGDRIPRLECAVDAGGDDRGHPLRRSGGGAGRASRDRGRAGADGQGAECAGRSRSMRAGRRPLRDPAAGRPGALAAGPGADSHAAGHRHPRARCAADRGPGPARGHLRRIGRGQEHADRHDDPQHRGRCDRGGSGGRAWPRSGRVSRRCARRGGPGALGGGGFHLRPVAVAAHEGGAGCHHIGGVLCRPGKACAAGARFAHPLCHGRPRDRPGGRRAAYRQRVYALGLYAGWRAWWSAPGSSASGPLPPFIRC